MSGVVFKTIKLVLFIGLATNLLACDDGASDQKQGTVNDVNILKEESKQQTKQKSFVEKDVGLLSSPAFNIKLDEVEAYKAKIQEILVSDLPVVLLKDVQADMYEAQAIAVAHPEVQRNFYLNNLNSNLTPDLSEEPLRNEVMSVRKTLPSDLTISSKTCHSRPCARVNIYNFYHNATSSIVVDLSIKKVVSISTIEETQPDISSPLKDIALSIAKASPLARSVLQKKLSNEGRDMDIDDFSPLMAEIKSALKDTMCERSKHLCVAPTYVVGDQALWVIVDLTDFRVVGVRWTELRESGPPIIVTERTLENNVIFAEYCQKINQLNKQGWEFDYLITGSDGLEVRSVKYKNQPVIQSAKLVDWHVSYSSEDAFGYSDAAGCPLFSAAVVVAYNSPKVEEITENGVTIGFALVQDFRQHPWPAACNYRYEQRYEFYLDGRFRTAFANHGKGCGNYGTYRPVLRVQLDKVDSQSPYALSRWQQDSWQTVGKETWSSQDERQSYQDKYSHRIQRADGKGYFVEPAQGQFSDGGRGDKPFIYVSVAHEGIDEGESDLVTLGSCCNDDYQQGPDKFVSPKENTEGMPLVFWYVAQMKNDSKYGSQYCWADTKVENGVKKIKTWPCYGGPMFTPINAVRN